MTPQEKNVFNKLFKTELGTHKVELGVVQDAEKAISDYFNSTDTANSKIKGAIASLREAEQFVKSSVEKSNILLKLKSDIEKQAKDLGIDANNIQTIKDINLAISDSKEYKSYSDKLNKVISTL
jgi:hypothetical protein